MQLIGAGLPRTGTLTQKEALELLGVGPCYHWVNLITDPDAVAHVAPGGRRRGRLR